MAAVGSPCTGLRYEGGKRHHTDRIRSASAQIGTRGHTAWVPPSDDVDPHRLRAPPSSGTKIGRTVTLLLGVDCPSCHAAHGEWCRDANGYPCRGFHPHRRDHALACARVRRPTTQPCVVDIETHGASAIGWDHVDTIGRTGGPWPSSSVPDAACGRIPLRFAGYAVEAIGPYAVTSAGFHQGALKLAIRDLVYAPGGRVQPFKAAE